MAAINIAGGVTGNLAEVDPSGNLGAQMISTLDPGQITGSVTVRKPTTSIFNRLAVGLDTVRFSDYFNETVQNTGNWKSAANLFTFTQASGYLTFNASSITTTAAAQIYQSYPSFSMFGSMPLMFEFSEYRTAVPPSNYVAEAGLFLANVASTPYTPTDGVYFRFNSTGLLGVLNYNGTETTVQLLTAAQMVLNDNTTYRFVINHYRVEFWGASATSDPRQLLGILPVPSVNGPPFSSGNVPIAFRVAHTGTAGSAQQFKVANAVVIEQDTDQGDNVAHLMAAMGGMGAQGQDGGTLGSTALYSNSLAPGAGAAMTNTTAALGTGLGGQFAALPTLAANTDGILCSFQNPASAVNQQGRTLYITGVRIQGMVTTVLVGGPVQYFYSLAFGHTAVSMATAEAVAAKAPRRVPLGMEVYPATAAVDTVGSAGIYMPFYSPIVINPGEFVAVVAKNVGTVTSSGVITFLVTFDAYWR